VQYTLSLPDAPPSYAQEPKKGKRYYMGVDLAKSHDYTVIVIIDEGGHVVYFDRFNDISWTIQKKRVVDIAQYYNAAVLVDSTGVGDPVLDDLLYHISVDGFKFSNTSKRQLVENLSIGIERGSISFFEIPELIEELSTFAYDQSETGLIRYNAPDGLHDDCVIALALAYWHYTQNSGMTEAFSDVGNSRQMASDIWS
jgi:phage FluMu gp28-like protein